MVMAVVSRPWWHPDMQRLTDEGCKHIIYIQVDNILVPIDDPILLGAAVPNRLMSSTRSSRRPTPTRRSAIWCVGERDRIIEYTELGPEETRQTDADGQLIDAGGPRPCIAGVWPSRAWPIGPSGSPASQFQAPEVTRWPGEVPGFRVALHLRPILEAPVSIGLEIDRRVNSPR